MPWNCHKARNTPLGGMRIRKVKAVSSHRTPPSPSPHTTIIPKLGVTHALELSQSAEYFARWYEDTKGKGGVEPPQGRKPRLAKIVRTENKRDSGPSVVHAAEHSFHALSRAEGPKGHSKVLRTVERAKHRQPRKGRKIQLTGAERRTGTRDFRLACREGARESFAPPGLSRERYLHPRLAPWATFCRRSAAGRQRKGFRLTPRGLHPGLVLARPVGANRLRTRGQIPGGSRLAGLPPRSSLPLRTHKESCGAPRS